MSKVIKAQGLVRRYPADGSPIRAVDDVDLVVEAGEAVSVMGPSGCVGDPLVRLRVAGTAAASTYRGLSRGRGTEGVWCLARSHVSDPSSNSDTRQRNAYGYLR